MKFVVLGDLHFTEYETEEAAAARDLFFETLFRQVAAQDANRIFAIGDIVQSGTPAEIQKLYSSAARHGIELMAITGNHDTGAFPKDELRPYFVEGRAKAEELYYAFSQSGVRFVLLDTSRELMGENWSGIVSPAQLEWLAQEVETFKRSDNGDQYLVVMGHHPVYGTTTRSTENWLNIVNSDEVRDVLGQVRPGQALYICGHNHVNSIAGPDDGGWTYVQCGAPLLAFSFRLITANETGVQVETIDFGLDDPQLAEVMPHVYAGLEHFEVVPLEKAAGQPADRQWEIGNSH